MQQTDRRKTRHIDEFVTTVNNIEQATGLDFFPELPDDEEEAVESESPPDPRWHAEQKLVPTEHHH